MTETSPAPRACPAGSTQTISVRFFAGAAEAAGAEELRLPVPGHGIAVLDLLAQLPRLVEVHQPTVSRGDEASGDDASGDHDDAASPSLERVCARSSFLINGVRAQAQTARLYPGDQLDVLPPFAGG